VGSNVTLKEIAKELGMSAMTVSRALNNKDNVDKQTKKRIVEKARSMGYTPNHVAKSLVSRKTYTIGVVIPEIYHAFFSEVVSGIEEVSYKRNYQLFLTNSAEKYEREKSSLNALQSKRVDGILISCAETSSDTEYYRQIINTGLPFVFFDRCIENIGASCVCVNDYESSKKITTHLVDHGYKRIAHLSGPENVTIANKRKQGYLDALGDHGIPVDDTLLEESGLSEKGGYEAMIRLLDRTSEKPPRAVFAINDPAAFGAIKAIKEKGLSIPGDVAIVGFSDDIRSELIACPLTTVRQPAFLIGKRAAQKLIDTIDNKDEPIEKIELENKIIIRQSCGCPPNDD
jgi:DNA-binding LacI/PurR family transcriptional regulator